jgi:NAD(P)H-hydrate epimerase
MELNFFSGNKIMKVATADQIREIDRISIEEYGIPQSVLMYNAGYESAKYIIDNFLPLKKVIVFSGTGNNGGDGFVTAYILKNSGILCDIVLCSDSKKLTESSKLYHDLCVKSEVSIMENSELIDFSGYDLIIDAISGTGFTGTPRNEIAETIRLINNSGIKIVSLDIPGGMSSDGKAVEAECIHAHTTVTMGIPKISLVTYPNKKFCGKIHIADIGFPKKLTESDELKTSIACPEIFSKYLKSDIHDDIHKTENGTLLLIGGFDGMEGAIMLSAMAAFETGIGLAALITSENSRNIIAGKIPELMTKGIGNKNIEKEILNLITEKKYDGCIIGPGLGRDSDAAAVFSAFFKSLDKSSIKKVLIDGDGLYHLSIIKEKLNDNNKINIITTPHFMEASRILGQNIEIIKNERLSFARELALKTGSVTVLKGPSSITTDGGNSIVNTSGNSLLASAGSGDVLSGIIGALMMRDIPVIVSASMGAYIHGLCADLFFEENEFPKMKAGDIIRYIRRAMNNIKF